MWNVKTNKPETESNEKLDGEIQERGSLVSRIAKLRLRGKTRKRDIEGLRDQLIGATERRKGRKLA